MAGKCAGKNVKLILGLFSLLLMAAKTDSLCLLVETYCGVKVETNRWWKAREELRKLVDDYFWGWLGAVRFSHQIGWDTLRVAFYRSEHGKRCLYQIIFSDLIGWTGDIYTRIFYKSCVEVSSRESPRTWNGVDGVLTGKGCDGCQ